VTDTSEKPPSGHRYRLRTFGTLALAGPGDDTLLGKHGHQRRRLALLAVLAAAGERGRSRDQLMLLFWPDATQSLARHSLEQLMYAIRNSIDEAVFAGVNPVRLNREMVSSDVGDFLDALESGDLEVAIGKYGGPFLDGFYLSDAPEFEQWLSTERARLERSYSDALERLAQSAEAAQDHASAVRWWRMLAETDPVSSKNATGLIRALMNAGDHAAALQYAEHYEAVVTQELGTSAGPAVANLVAEVRAKAKTEPVTASRPAPVLPRFKPIAAPVPVGAPPSDQPQPQRAPRRRSAPYVIGGMLILVLIATALWLRATRGERRPPVATGEPSIAVLPFTNVTGDQHDAALVDGLTEEMIAVLAKIRNLRVIARTSAFAFRNSNVGVRRIGDSLGVSNLLEGSVQKVGTQLRVQVRLVDARDGSTRWSETYDRELKDIFSVQSEIAGAVARELDLRLGESALARIEHGSTRNIAAYELYLRGNNQTLLRSDSGVRAGLEYFRQAIALDPNYAAAYAGLARLQGRVAVNDTVLPRRDRLALAEKAALKAVALDDSSGDAHAALSAVRRENYDMASAESELMRAVSLEPTNPRFREWLVQLYIVTERPAEALAQARGALELDPLSPTANAELAHALLANDRCDEALAQLDKLKSLRPPLLRAGSIAAQCYARKKMWPQAIAELQQISANAGTQGQAKLGYLLARAGRTDEARRTLAALLDRSRRINGRAFDVATVYAGLGENDQAFKWLDKALDDRSLDALNVDYMLTTMDGLWPDPRFDALRGRLGLKRR
jgi:TolB-like protein/DNA-binding SARP family transcriptional activator